MLRQPTSTFPIIQALQVFLKHDPECLNYLSRSNQDCLMSAVNDNNVPMIKFILDNSSTISYTRLDDWRFSCLTYSIKNNCLAAFCYLISRGCPLDDDQIDSNGCSPVHWAAFVDRKFMLGIMFRAGFDFSRYDSTGKTPWDRAIENWSIFSMNFMIDYSLRPLKTKYFLGDSRTFDQVDLIPELQKIPVEDIQSYYIPKQVQRLQRIRKGAFTSPMAMIRETLGTGTLDYIKYNWYSHNIREKYWLKTYMFCTSALLCHWLSLLFCPYKAEDISASLSVSPQFTVYYIIFTIASLILTICAAFNFGSGR